MGGRRSPWWREPTRIHPFDERGKAFGVTAIGLARLGVPCGFVGGISSDLFGRAIEEHTQTSGVDLRYAARSRHQTTLAFVRMVAGEGVYAVYDVESASRNWACCPGLTPFCRNRGQLDYADRSEGRR